MVSSRRVLMRRISRSKVSSARSRSCIMGKTRCPAALSRIPRAAAHQQRKANILFQAVHHVCQARLRVAQHLRRPGKAAGLHRRGQRLQLFGVHTPPSLS